MERLASESLAETVAHLVEVLPTTDQKPIRPPEATVMAASRRIRVSLGLSIRQSPG